MLRIVQIADGPASSVPRQDPTPSEGSYADNEHLADCDQQLIDRSGRDAVDDRAAARLRSRIRSGGESGAGGGSSNGKPFNQERWLTDPDRDPLPLLAAGADALIEGQIVPHRPHPGQAVRSVADQGRSFDRCGDLAVLDQVSFRRGEDERARGDVALTAAEGLGVQAALDA